MAMESFCQGGEEVSMTEELWKKERTEGEEA